MSCASVGFIAYSGLAAATFRGGLNSTDHITIDELKGSLTASSLLAIASTVSYIAHAVLIDSLSYQAYSIGNLCGFVSVVSGVLALGCLLAAIGVAGHLFGATLRKAQELEGAVSLQRDEITLLKFETALIQLQQGPIDRKKCDELKSWINAAFRRPSAYPQHLQPRITYLLNQIDLLGR